MHTQFHETRSRGPLPDKFGSEFRRNQYVYRESSIAFSRIQNREIQTGFIQISPAGEASCISQRDRSKPQLYVRWRWTIVRRHTPYKVNRQICSTRRQKTSAFHAFMIKLIFIFSLSLIFMTMNRTFIKAVGVVAASNAVATIPSPSCPCFWPNGVMQHFKVIERRTQSRKQSGAGKQFIHSVFYFLSSRPFQKKTSLLERQLV